MSVLLPCEAGDKPGQGQQGLIAPTSHNIKAGVVSWFRKMRQMATTNPEGRPGAKDQNQRCEVRAEPYRQQGKESVCPDRVPPAKDVGPACSMPRGSGERCGWH